MRSSAACGGHGGMRRLRNQQHCLGQLQVMIQSHGRVCACVCASGQSSSDEDTVVRSPVFVICCCSAGGGGEQGGECFDWLSVVDGGSLSCCLSSSLRPGAGLPGCCSRSENSGSGCGASCPSTSVKRLPGSCRPGGALSAESVVPPCCLPSAESL